VCGACAVALVTVMGACRRGDDPPPDGVPVPAVPSAPAPSVGEPEATAPDLLADAPADPVAFLAWAEERLATFPAPVAVPPPRPGPPRWPVVYLVDRLAAATITGALAPAPAAPAPLLRIGPFRSDTPAAGVTIATPFDRKLGNFVSMHLGGFAVPTADVGSIQLEIRVPFGRHVEVSWSSLGFARMPLPDNESFWTLRVATGGFSDWDGMLRALAVRTDGVGAGVVEIRALELQGHREAYPEAVAVTPVTLAGIRRPAIYARPATVATFADVAIPPAGVLRLGLGHLAEGGTADVVIDVVAGGAPTRVLERRLTAAAGWEEVAVSLAPWAGQRVALAFGADSTAADDVVFWGDPTLYAPVADPPLIVVYLIDTLSAEHVELYGHDRPTMPTLGALADTGAWFERMYCNSPVTVSSIPDLMLSVPTERHGVHSPSLRPPDAFLPLPAVLRAAGFATFSAVTNVNAGPRQAMDRGFGVLVDRIAFAKESTADRTVPLAETRAWLETHADRPAFLYVHTAEPHAPYLPPPGYAGRFDPDYPGGLALMPVSGLPIVRTTRDVQHVRALYDEEVLYADARLAAFLAVLSELGVRARTTVLVTADHGEELLDHGEWGHGPSLYDEVLRVPLVMAGPGVAPVGRVARPVQMYDVMPTVLDLAGVAPAHPLAGESLLPLVARAGVPAASDDGRTIVVSHHRYWGHGTLEYAVIEGRRWKLIFRYQPRQVRPDVPASRFELYDVEADPDEYVDRVRDQPAVVRRLVGSLLAYRHRQPAVAMVPARAVDYDPAQLQQLRALGYIE
jgi:arylsulfatase A-like enzyme